MRKKNNSPIEAKCMLEMHQNTMVNSVKDCRELKCFHYSKERTLKHLKDMSVLSKGQISDRISLDW